MNIFEKPRDGSTRSMSSKMVYTSTDERGSLKNGAIERSASKSAYTNGFYSVPDENDPVFTSSESGDEEPVILGHISDYGVLRFDGTRLLQGERYVCNKDRTGNVSISKNGDICVMSLQNQFVESGEGGNISQKNSESKYQKILINPKTGEFKIETGDAVLSGNQVAFTPVGKFIMKNDGSFEVSNDNGGMTLGADGIINLN